MRNKKIAVVVLLMGSFLTTKAHALFDIKLTYGLLASNPGLGDLYSGTTTLPSIAPTYGWGADAVIKLPLIPIGFGLRYENMGMTVSSSGLEFKTAYTRTALLLNYRLIDTLLYLGPIATYGLSHSTDIKATENGSDQSHFSSDSVSSYSIGVEAGVKLLTFSVGAELGYEDFRWKGAKDSTGHLSDRDINMSGTYGKIMVGFGI